MNKTYPLIDAETAQMKISRGINMVEAIHAAMASGLFNADEYIDALSGAIDYLGAANKDLNEGIMALFDEARAKRNREGAA